MGQHIWEVDPAEKSNSLKVSSCSMLPYLIGLIYIGILGQLNNLLSFAWSHQELDYTPISKCFPTQKGPDRMLVPSVHRHLLHHMDALRFGICLYSSTCFLDKTKAFEVSQPVRHVVHQRCNQHCNGLCNRYPPNTYHKKP